MISLKKKTTTCWSNKNYYLLTKLLSCFSCVQLCDLIDGSPPGSPVPGILQARTLEWVAISFSNAWKVKVKSLSRVRLLATPWTAAHQAPPPMGFSRQEHWSGVPLPSPIGCAALPKEADVYHLPSSTYHLASHQHIHYYIFIICIYDPLGQGKLLSSFYRWGQWSLERLSNLWMVAQH